MLKKKNIAMIMAAATVATSVAPAFATSLDKQTISVKDDEKVAALKAEVKGYLDTKYTEVQSGVDADGTISFESVTKNTSPYSVSVEGKQGGATLSSKDITSVKGLQEELDKLTQNGDNLVITVKNTTAFNKVDEEITNWKTAEYKISDLAGVITAAEGLKDTKEVEDVEKIDKNTVSIALKNNDTPLVIKTGDAKLNIKAEGAIYKKDDFGNFLDKEGNIIKSDDNDNKVVIGFDYNKYALEESDKEADKVITVNYQTVNAEELKGSDLYNPTTKRLTEQGDDLARLIRDYNIKSATKATVTRNGLSITVDFPVNVDGIVKSTLKITGTSTEITAINAQLEKARTTGKIDTLAGDSRVTTAIEVSKDAFTTASNVVLVSGDVIADGLAATTFAKSLNAPVLLTGKDAVSEETMDEIERLEATKVYVVGGKSVISEEVRNQLEAKNIAVERIAGEDRFETSLKIAKKIVDVKSSEVANEVFIAGGYAEADTMSVAAVAAQGGKVDNSSVDPILLVSKDGLSKDQKEWLEAANSSTKAYVIGGENSVAKEVEVQLEDVVSGEVKRLAGDSRQETNAQVIKEFYTAPITNVYVAKSDNKGLVDALSAGVAAAADNTTPVVLATDELHSSQKAVLNTIKPSSDITKKQVGYGIADKVWEAINKLF